MEYIIAGHFESQAQVELTLAALKQAHIEETAIATFYLTPPRQQEHAEATLAQAAPAPAAEKSRAGSAKGIAAGVVVGAVAGAAGTPAIGPVAPALGALAGAYVGSLTGGISQIKKTTSIHDPDVENSEPRQPGLMVAVCVQQPTQEAAVIAALRATGATDIERGAGRVAEGRWQDFDPLLPLMRIG